jgi:hypothetical protein
MCGLVPCIHVLELDPKVCGVTPGCVSGRCGLGKGTFAGASDNDEDAPIADLVALGSRSGEVRSKAAIRCAPEIGRP